MLSFFSRKQKKPVVVGKKPVVEVKKPIVEVSKPIVEAPKPVVEASKPVVEDPKPVVETPKPVVETQKSVVEAPKPVAEETTETMTSFKNVLPTRLAPQSNEGGLGVPQPRRHGKSQSAFVSCFPLISFSYLLQSLIVANLSFHLGF